MSSPAAVYDPFSPGGFVPSSCTLYAEDTARSRRFPVEIWHPEAAGAAALPMILFSHSSGGNRRQSTFLCAHLASHGYLVAAPDHSETFAPELARREGETRDEKAARGQAWIANRVPDVRFLLDYLLSSEAGWPGARPDAARLGIVGHSFGGWTALASVEADDRIAAAVALAPGGSTHIKPGVLPLKLAFRWTREVPVMYLVGEADVSLPIEGMYELFERTPGRKWMFVLRRADHLHFMDNLEAIHEAVRGTSFADELSWLPGEMRPIAELCKEPEAHLFTRGLTTAHFDCVLRHIPEARELVNGAEGVLQRLGVDAFEHKTG